MRSVGDRSVPFAPFILVKGRPEFNVLHVSSAIDGSFIGAIVTQEG